MIDRRRFVQSMIALGASTSLRPRSVFAEQAGADIRNLADAALDSARKAGAKTVAPASRSLMASLAGSWKMSAANADASTTIRFTADLDPCGWLR